MSKSKKNYQHAYTQEQNDWIGEHPHLRRSDLAKKFNKKFDTKLSPIAIAKRKQRMSLDPLIKKSAKDVRRSSFELKGETVSVKELLGLIREQGRLIEKLIEKL